MSRFQRVYLSSNRLEWWNLHLAGALSREVAIIQVPMARFSQPGHETQADLRDLITNGVEHSFYLGSTDQLFDGIAEMEMPTAVWSDCLLPLGAYPLDCLRLFDVVLVTQKDSVAAVSRAGIRQVEWLPFAFDTSLRNDPAADKRYDVGFVGSLDNPPTRAERTEVLSRLERQYVLNDFRTPAFGDDMMRIYNQSRIVVNIPVPGGFNMRTFEALASGALLLTKAVGNGQGDLFRDGVHLVTYRDTADLLDKIAYYLRHERERREIADAGMREVLARHTYAHRAAALLDTMARAARMRARGTAPRAAAYGAFYDYLARPDLLAAVALGRGVPVRTRLRLLLRAVAGLRRVAMAWRRRRSDG